MTIERLGREQLISLYPEVKRAFPADERKSLRWLLRSYDDGTYDCFGLFEEHEVRGYAYFYRTGRHALLDYFSVLPAWRDEGFGGEFLTLLADYFGTLDSVLAEVEDPAFAEDDADRALRERRVGFYLRNGFTDAGVTVLVFGVRYRLLCSAAAPLTADEARSVYRQHYQAMLPPAMFHRHISI